MKHVPAPFIIVLRSGRCINLTHLTMVSPIDNGAKLWVHGENDYWLITPEEFEELKKEFREIELNRIQTS